MPRYRKIDVIAFINSCSMSVTIKKRLGIVGKKYYLLICYITLM